MNWPLPGLLIEIGELVEDEMLWRDKRRRPILLVTLKLFVATFVSSTLSKALSTSIIEDSVFEL